LKLILSSNRTLLEFAKKKRKRTDSGSDVDLGVTPPRSPRDEGGTPIEKRRSGRNTNKQKKYVDEIDLNLSDDDNIMSTLPPEFTVDAVKSDSNVPSAVPSVINEDSTMNGDVTQNSELNLDDSSKQQSDVDMHAGGPNYAYVVSCFPSKRIGARLFCQLAISSTNNSNVNFGNQLVEREKIAFVGMLRIGPSQVN